MRKLYRSIVQPYENGPYANYVRAGYLRIVNIAIFVIVPMVVVFNLLFLHGWRPELILPLAVLFVVSGLNLMLLARGSLAAAAHTLFVVTIGGVWAIMFTDQAGVLIRFNTIVFVFCLLSMLPLLVQKRRWTIPAYFVANTLVFLLFIMQQHSTGELSTLELHDTVIDTLVALLFTGIASHAIFMVSQRTLMKVRDEKQSFEETRKLLNRIIDEMPSIMLSVDSRGVVTSCNKLAGHVSDFDTTTSMGVSIFSVLPSLKHREDAIRQVIAGEHSFVETKTAALEETPDTLYDLTVYPLTPGNADGAVIRLDDVTREVGIEQMLVQSEKMSSVGGLAAGMAHEINNPLGGIIQGIQLIEHRLDPAVAKNKAAASQHGISMESLRNYLDDRNIPATLENLSRSGRNAARIVANMLAFARKETGLKKELDINVLLQEVIELASNDYDLNKRYDFRKVKINTSYENNLPSTLGEASKIQQVLFNILHNGAHAMSAKKNSADAPAEFKIRSWSTASHVHISISDNGPGISEENQHRIFEPFFTTKGVGVGTGLGLSVSYFIIVDDHSGTLEVGTTPDGGAIFTIGLPR